MLIEGGQTDGLLWAAYRKVQDLFPGGSLFDRLAGLFIFRQGKLFHHLQESAGQGLTAFGSFQADPIDKVFGDFFLAFGIGG